MQRRTVAVLAGVSMAGAALLSSGDAGAARTLQDYRYFRALSVDLAGHVPTREDLAAFESDSFDLDKWIDARLAEPGYEARIRRTYMDLLRLDVSSVFTYRPAAAILRRATILGPDGKKLYVFFRNGQRRVREETDGAFCFTKAEVGVTFLGTGQTIGTLKNVDAATLDKNTKVVKPWWLYKDYTASVPGKLYGTAAFPAGDGGFTLLADLQNDTDGKPATSIRVCNEEASTSTTGTVFASGRTKGPPAGTPPPYDRAAQLPLDDAFATANKGAPIACDGGSAYTHSTDCGCGVGLDRCLPAAGAGVEPAAFVAPVHVPLGESTPMDVGITSEGGWTRFWWSEEAVKFLEYVAREDRDFREVLTGHYTLVNGPLAQFYGSGAGATCCGQALSLGYVHPEPLLDPKKLPAIAPQDAATWKLVDDRGPNASGILTMPIFLTKFGTRRGRAHVLYQAFQCRDFIAGNVKLTPSTEPDLTKRDGCSTCHATLEPMAAYFTRVVESDWTWLPKDPFPLQNTVCKSTNGSGACKSYYDPAFATTTQGLLRGAYASLEHADLGPAGLAKDLATSPEFGSCVVNNVLGSFLGRQLSADDATLVAALAKDLEDGGFKLKNLVREIVHSDLYRKSNDLDSNYWREAGGAP